MNPMNSKKNSESRFKLWNHWIIEWLGIRLEYTVHFLKDLFISGWDLKMDNSFVLQRYNSFWHIYFGVSCSFNKKIFGFNRRSKQILQNSSMHISSSINFLGNFLWLLGCYYMHLYMHIRGNHQSDTAFCLRRGKCLLLMSRSSLAFEDV